MISASNKAPTVYLQNTLFLITQESHFNSKNIKLDLRTDKK